MDNEFLNELSESMLQMFEATVATGDMLALLCMHFAKASPGPASELLGTLKRLQGSVEINRTQSFTVLATRMEQALSNNPELQLLSLRLPKPATPEEMRARLRVIRGGVD